MADSNLPSSSDLEFLTPDKMAPHIGPEVEYVDLTGPDRRLAYKHLKGKCPTLLYIPGFLSTMEIYKALAVEQYAKLRGISALRYDQSSVGKSSGVTRQETNNVTWIKDALAMVDLVAKEGPIILIASSNGGWISTYVASVRPERIQGLVLIGPAFNFPRLGYEKILAKKGDVGDLIEMLHRGEALKYQTPYGEGYFTLKEVHQTKEFELDFENGIEVKCPVRVLHAYSDSEVEWRSSLKLLESLQSSNVDLILRKTGNHRLMKPTDLTLLIFTLDRLVSEHHKGVNYTLPDDTLEFKQNSKL